MSHSQSHLGVLAAAVLVAVAAATPHPAGAQDQDGPIFVPENSERIGFNGDFRAGTWTPLVIHVHNRSEQIRSAVAEWTMPDFDGDDVVARRLFTIQPNGPTFVRLFAVPALNITPDKRKWTIRVADAETGELLATDTIIPGDRGRELPQQVSSIALLGRGAPKMGLQLFQNDHTQHETIVVNSGLDPVDLPDRWYAYSLFEAIIWSPRAGDPTSAAIQPQMAAIREWVRRGGHLVVVLPSVGNYWSKQEVSDLLPPVRIEAVREIAPPQAVYPKGLPDNVQNILSAIRTPAHTFSPLGDENELSVLARTADDEAIVVAHSYGFGRVTLIGVDLTDPALLAPGATIRNDPKLQAELNALGMPAPESALWGDVFGWLSPGYSANHLLDLKDRKYTPPGWAKGDKNPQLAEHRDVWDLSPIVTEPLAMRETAVGALLVAFFLFAIYWMVAGPVSFAVLRSMRISQHSWAIFGLIVLVFSAVAWGGAYLIRPTDTRIQHFTVLDADATTGEVHTHSWMTLFVPTHGQVQVTVGGEADKGVHNTIASAGVLYTPDPGGFPDRREYRIDATKPNAVTLPMRATAKQLEVDYMGQPAGVAEGHPLAWSFFTGKVTYDAQRNTLTGNLTNNLPAEMTDVLFVYCPGDGQTYTWQLDGAWKPGQTVSATPPPNRNTGLSILSQNAPLAKPPAGDFYKPRTLKFEGFLGEVIDKPSAMNNPNQLGGAPAMIERDDIVRHTWLLTFYGKMPPPDFIERGGFGQYYGSRPGQSNLTRKAGRPFDLTEHTALRRLIIMGHVKTEREDGVPLPTPVLIDGEKVESRGHTVVRWITRVQ